MYNSNKEYWLGSYEQPLSFSTIIRDLINPSEDNEREPRELLDTLLADSFQPGYTYTIPFDSNCQRLSHLLAMIINQFFNIYKCDYFSDALNLIIVDNELEKKLLAPVIEELLTQLNGDSNYYSFFTTVEEVNQSANGCALLTLDELPLFLTKMDYLIRNREVELATLSSTIHGLIRKNGNKNVAIADLEPEQLAELERKLEKAEIKPREKLDNLYVLNDYIENMKEFFLSCTTDYKFNYFQAEGKVADFLVAKAKTATSEGVQDSTSSSKAEATAPSEEVVNQDLEVFKDLEAQQEISCRNFPLGLVYLYSAHLYNSSYVEGRKHLLDLCKVFQPLTMVWAEYKHQEYFDVSTISTLPIKNIPFPYHQQDLSEKPFFFYTGKVSSTNRLNLEAFKDLQDYRRCRESSGLTFSSKAPYSIRCTLGKNFTKLHDVDTQLILALFLALQGERNVLYVVKDLESTLAEVERVVGISSPLKACSKKLAIVEANSLLFYPYNCQALVVGPDVELTFEMIAHASSLLYTVRVENKEYSPLFILGSGENKKAKGKTLDYSQQQKDLVTDYLRDRRFKARCAERFEDKIIPICNSDQCRQTYYYFNHQEKREWNSQLSGDKFLTVRNNNLEISYYPNLNRNPMVLFGFNNHYFDSSLVIEDQGLINPQLQPIKYRNLNLNSGDLISNISIAIHRIINLFSTRHLKVASSENLTACWLVANDQKELIPVYQKLFSNIFNKEPNTKVRVANLAELEEERSYRSKLLVQARKYFNSDNYEKVYDLLQNHPDTLELGVNQEDINSPESQRKVEEIGAVVQYLHDKDEGSLEANLLELSQEDYGHRKDVYNTCVLQIKRFVLLYNSYLQSIARENLYNTKGEAINIEDPVEKIVERIKNLIKSPSPLHQSFIDSIPKDKGIVDQVQKVINYLEESKGKGTSNLILATVGDYVNSILSDYRPDIVVIESTYDLYSHDKAKEFASAVLSILGNKAPTNLVLVSSPENDAEALLEVSESLKSSNRYEKRNYIYSKRYPLINLSLDLGSAERFAYVVDFATSDFTDPAYTNFKFEKEQIAELKEHYQEKNSHQLPFVSLDAFTMPLSAYSLPLGANIDYKVIEKGQLPATKEHGYVPAIGESAVDIFVNYHPFTTSRLLNAALCLLLQSKNTKARGLVVVNNKEVLELFKALGEEFNFIAHDFNSIKYERGLFSHAVIIADSNDDVEQSIVQHVALITRGFKSTGNIFLLCNAKEQSCLLALLAQNSPYLAGASRTVQLSPTELNSSARRQDAVSPYFSINGLSGYVESLELLGKARKDRKVELAPSLNPFDYSNLKRTDNVGKKKNKRKKR